MYRYIASSVHVFAGVTKVLYWWELLSLKYKGRQCYLFESEYNYITG